MTDLTLFELALACIAFFTLATLLVTLWRFATLRYPYDDGDACDLADLLVWANSRSATTSANERGVLVNAECAFCGSRQRKKWL